jgi:hypothetical protein
MFGALRCFMKSSLKNPGSIYRGAPFWAWNNRLDAEQLKRKIGFFKEMGLRGFLMHPPYGHGYGAPQ